jgi:hypothetical protein
MTIVAYIKPLNTPCCSVSSRRTIHGNGDVSPLANSPINHGKNRKSERHHNSDEMKLMSFESGN